MGREPCFVPGDGFVVNAAHGVASDAVGWIVRPRPVRDPANRG